MSISQVVSVLGLALVMWSAISASSSYLAEEPLRSHGHEIREANDKPNMQNVEAVLAEIRDKLEANPDSPDAHSDYGYALLNVGVATGDGEKLIEALKQFDRAIALNPKQANALFGIASVSLRVGVADKAAEYYERYLEVQPDDIRGLSDYGLALLRLGRHEEAAKVLDRALSLEPNSVPVLMVYAMVERARNDSEHAIELATRALSIEQSGSSSAGEKDDAQSLQRRVDSIKSFLADVGGIEHSEESKSDRLLGSARAYFLAHPVLGSKIQDLSLKQDVLLVTVQDFPVEQMPEFAKKRFEESINKQFQEFKPTVNKVDILELGTEKTLLEIPITSITTGTATNE